MDPLTRFEQKVGADGIKLSHGSPPAIDICTGEIAVIKVGPNEKEFRVHMPLLEHYSEYFQGAFRSRLQGGPTRCIILKDIAVPTFTAFVSWLYTSSFGGLLEWEVEGAPAAHVIVLVVNLHIFADRFLIPSLGLASLGLLVRKLEHYKFVPYLAIVVAFDNLPASSSLLELLEDTYVQTAKRSRIESERPSQTHFDLLPPAFLRRVMAKYADLVAQNPAMIDGLKVTEGEFSNISGTEDVKRSAKRVRRSLVGGVVDR